MRQHLLPAALLFSTVVPVENAAVDDWKQHHHHHHHRQGYIRHSKNVTSQESHELLAKIRRVVHDLDAKVKSRREPRVKGTLEMNAPLPEDFAELFANGVASATGYEPQDVGMVMQKPLNVRDDSGGPLVEVSFEAPAKAVKYLEAQAQDPDSKLAAGVLCPFLVSREPNGGLGGQCGTISTLASGEKRLASEEEAAPAPAPKAVDAASPAISPADEEGAASEPEPESQLDVDTAMPYGDLEPFGREDTAQELTEKSITESDAMVDQLERAEVAEEKRAAFRALTRLRGAAITSFDGVARAQTGNIDDFAKEYKWREQHPIHHLAQQESDVSKWAFPDF